MKVETEKVLISTPDGHLPAFLYESVERSPQPAILLLMEAFGLMSHIQDVAIRTAQEGYVVLAPDLYYRELPNNTFGYDDVEQAMAMMYRLDFGTPIQEDIRAAIADSVFLLSEVRFIPGCQWLRGCFCTLLASKTLYLKSHPAVTPAHIGVTGFCLGGGLTFFAACYFSGEIAAAAPFYGMVLDEWIDAIPQITVPLYVFHGGLDPFIPLERIQHIESRLKAHNKAYTLKLYPDADHGFFCHERFSYNRQAAEDAWAELTQFFRRHLKKSAEELTVTAGFKTLIYCSVQFIQNTF
ncbi:MAG: dienelactone hydrolase family protein [Leptolyngbyaceae cyanobacterium T60_A2020_046]|nr:dienelactone hydrolase family protein [Leptolyngbyaceae cyanobacterium T60_A2020_046]